ncbi:MAG: LytTR family DNA-binding domain-containing protein [Roseburia sp.]|nr:LytTR family DNA-binding domain-containing protein [Roseburia sp.]
MLKIAVCDDSREDVEVLESAFDELQQYAVEYDIYFSADELLMYSEMNKEKYHMYILDINMPKKDGFELAEEIRVKDRKALLVFLTSYVSNAMKAFEYFTFDFIEKPITVEKLRCVIDKAMEYLNLIKQDFVFNFRNNQFCVSYDDILYIAKKGRQAMIYTPSDSYKTNMTTKELWKQLDDQVFSHIHVSYIVNLQHIKAIQGNEVELDDGEHFVVARSRKKELKMKHCRFRNRII